ncbi:HpaII family restriction endonuclease [Sphingobacterium sp. SRCM116780]|uniref:HpaII family restriction endonuclease n=1 Tax=Sphingobacterium sp. SRCM116780 TaxID=2907623 RepID=UPI001F31DE79|nr:HpaII family restriction endonuclease [Sphingobacterium sp. SRCM116780]UIR54775.1 HpaII family restriction endonuclease [Sphingobacterium sp. SRCM116780]
MLTGNKGEWSEIYALFKLLGDGKMYAGDGDLNRVANLVYPIISILRKEPVDDFSYTIDNTNVNIIDSKGNSITVVAVEFLNKANDLLKAIKTNTKTFAIPEIESFMNTINSHSLKAKSTAKTDITIIIHDLRTGIQPVLGFSIKSRLGSPSTLLNAGETTNFVYKVENSNLSSTEIERINNIDSRQKLKDRITAIGNTGSTLRFVGTQKQVFQNNLILIDSMLPQILSSLLLLSAELGDSNLERLCEKLEERNPLNFDTSTAHLYYNYKLKRLLVDIALGMMPGKIWNGIYEANGGYLVVKENGDVLCYHVYNRNEFEDYLLKNTKLETPSTTKHKFGLIYQENGENFFKLNLQIRFI